MDSFKSAIKESTRKLVRISHQDYPSALPMMDLTKYFEEESERSWTEPFTFVVAADTQFGLIERYILQRPDPRWNEEIVLTRSAIRCINKMRPKPKFLVICGDMLDELPKDQKGSNLREEQYADFVGVFEELDPDIPLVCACGNHDICDVPTEKSYQIYREQFGPDFFSFWVGGVKFVVVNSQYFKQPDALPNMTERQEEFLNKINDASAKHLVVFQHIPFFVHHPEEPEVSYVNIENDMRFKMMDLYNKQGVDYVFCGHYHRNAGGRYKNFDQIVTTALGGTFGDDPSGFRMCQVTSQGIYHQYIPVMVDKTVRIPRSLGRSSVSRHILRKKFINYLNNANPGTQIDKAEEKAKELADSIRPSAVLSSNAQPVNSSFSLRDFLSMKLFH